MNEKINLRLAGIWCFVLACVIVSCLPISTVKTKVFEAQSKRDLTENVNLVLGSNTKK